MTEAPILLDYKLLMPPFVGAAIGWLTNYVAIKLLFRPHVPVEVFGFKLQGLIPKRRKEIARSIARTIEREILSSEDVAGMLRNMEWKDEVEKVIEEMVEHRFGSRIGKIPVIGLASENLKYHIKYLLTKEAVKQIDRKKDEIVARFRENVDVKELVVSRIDNLNFERFESLLTDFIARELKHLE